MDTQTPDAGTAGARPPTERGTLILNEKVLRKIASQAASELPFVGGMSGGVLGIGRETDLSARPKAEIELAGNTAFVNLAVALIYPLDLRHGTERLRDHVSKALQSWTGVTVGRLDIDVTALDTGSSDTARGRRELE
ncbi:hypothetical protein GCM10027403_15410 [Arthrobacter tecti]